MIRAAASRFPQGLKSIQAECHHNQSFRTVAQQQACRSFSAHSFSAEASEAKSPRSRTPEASALLFPNLDNVEWPEGSIPPESVSTARPTNIELVSSDDLPGVVDLEDVTLPDLTHDLPNFDDSRAAHGPKHVLHLMRAIAVLNVCKIGPLVLHSAFLINLSYKVLGKTVTNALLKPTFYQHFCAGEDSERMAPTINFLRDNGISSILDYCAENAPDSSNNDGDGSSKESESLEEEDIMNNQPARTYPYTSEKQCDEHRDIFLSCINSTNDVSPDKGFAALKVTALGHPLLLERMSRALNGIRNLFTQFDMDGDGQVTREEFETAYTSLFVDAEDKLPDLLERVDPLKTGHVDFISWSSLLTLKDLPRLTKGCRTVGPLSLASPTEEELQLMNNLYHRADCIANEAAEKGTKLLFDAEQTWYQPAIDNLVLEMQRKYNNADETDSPTVFNTYQCYLKDTPTRLMLDVDRSQRFNYHFAAKLVRGAYMNSERERATQEGVESPIRETVGDTHACFDSAMAFLLRHHAAEKQNGSKLQVMCATHNQLSIEKAMVLMKDLGVSSKEDTVHFAQLFGMSDNLSFILGKNGYSAYKYLPYGEVDEAIPYLLRRAVENRDMLKNNKKELHMLYQEVGRRINPFSSSK
jgi:proline dehydrogenase